MSDSNSEIDQLKAERRAARKEIDREIGRLSTRWGLARSPFRLYIVSPDRINLSYWIFLTICLVAGIVCTFQKEPVRTLGVSLVVGSLFAGGAVVGQVWAFAFQERHSLLEKALGDERTKDLEHLGEKFWELQKRIDHLQVDDHQRQSTRDELKAMLTSIYPDIRKLRLTTSRPSRAACRALLTASRVDV
jgi:hypothetical protein